METNESEITESEQSLNELQMLEPVPEFAQQVVQEGRALLQQPFNFYSFGIKLGLDEQIEVLYKAVIRSY